MHAVAFSVVTRQRDNAVIQLYLSRSRRIEAVEPVTKNRSKERRPEMIRPCAAQADNFYFRTLRFCDLIESRALSPNPLRDNI